MGAVSPPANPNILPPLLKPDVNICKNKCKYKPLKMQKDKNNYMRIGCTNKY